jgi:hypothetical protein
MENYPKKSKTDKVVDTIHVGAKLLSLDIGQWGTSPQNHLPELRGRFSMGNVQSLNHSKWECQSYNLDTEI